MFGQQLCRRLTHMADAQSRKKAGKDGLFAFLQGIQEILSRFLGHPLQSGELLLLQAVEIGDILDQFPVDQLIDEFLAQPPDVHGAAGAEELEALFELGRTRETDAAVGGFALLSINRGAADGAALGHSKFLFLPAPLFLDHLYDVGNDVPGSLHHDRVANADVFPFDFIHVVQRRALDDNAANGDGFQAGYGSQGSGAPHLGLDIEDARSRLAGFEFISDRPARRAGNLSQPALQLQAVDLDHHAVDLVRKLIAPSLHLFVIAKNFCQILATLVRRRFETPLPQRFEEFPLGGKSDARNFAHPMTENIQRPSSRDRRVKLL